MDSTASETDTLAGFVRQLWEAGQVGVLDVAHREFSPNDLDDAWLQLQIFASEERLALPGSPPDVSRSSAEWALVQMYRACSFLVHRMHAAEEMHAALQRQAPESFLPAVCYSMDLTFRYLPDLHRLAKTVSANDPLVAALEDWGRHWPLSSVGMEFRSPSETNPSDVPEPELVKFDLTGCWQDACLRRLYVDRVILREDVRRLNDPLVAEAVHAALGLYPELSPKMAAALEATSPSKIPPRRLAEG